MTPNKPPWKERPTTIPPVKSEWYDTPLLALSITVLVLFPILIFAATLVK